MNGTHISVLFVVKRKPNNNHARQYERIRKTRKPTIATVHVIDIIEYGVCILWVWVNSLLSLYHIYTRQKYLVIGLTNPLCLVLKQYTKICWSRRTFHSSKAYKYILFIQINRTQYQFSTNFRISWEQKINSIDR